ncbi:hypothetical protein PAXINDRAFT_19378 [Paxillus involutus ATCC 200175]|uniref:Uncharacterized protein n=1 Tax=Paxillus involutus ATCC 200175 TaxID=664439 RepID=A0A0C9THD8_PAXIN|nr:hypothetical protein PAXINDRAFT_19378 [Paxillus involutus ATCC 200175]
MTTSIKMGYAYQHARSYTIKDQDPDQSDSMVLPPKLPSHLSACRLLVKAQASRAFNNGPMAQHDIY